jgi:hypothetical protein
MTMKSRRKLTIDLDDDADEELWLRLQAMAAEHRWKLASTAKFVLRDWNKASREAA